MKGTVDDYYYEWLYSKVGSLRNRNPARSYWSMCKELYVSPFTWSVPNDDNRVEDGRQLRMEFLNSAYPYALSDPSWIDLECSMLEMLIAFSHRAAFNSYGTLYDWFWCLMENLGISSFTDNIYGPQAEREVRAACKRVVYRTYRANGKGGLFPLVYPDADQRKVEIWYQFAAYMLEHDRVQNGPRL